MSIRTGSWDFSGYGVDGGKGAIFNYSYLPDPDIQAQADAQLRNQKELLGFKSNLYGSLLNQLRSQVAPTATVQPPPQVSTGPVWDQGQIQSRVNAARASNDAATAGQIARMQGSMGARGFGAQSPLAMALQQRMQSENLATNTDAERSLRWDAAKGNAQQVLAGQKAASDSWHQYQQEQIAMAQIAAQQQNILTQAMLGLLG